MVRTTQRAPRSCVPCTTRKIKCDKSIPCQACIDRATVRDCKRETVLVRGRLRRGALGEPNATFEDLVQENARLRALLSSQGTAETDYETITYDGNGTVSSRPELAERYLFDRISCSSRTRSVRSWEDIVMPSREFSNKIVNHAFKWSFWIHYALFVPEFEGQHTDFWERFSTCGSLRNMDAFWLATYFSVLAANLLFMDETETAGLHPQDMGFMHLLRNWYESALYCLDQGDFMQVLDLNTVRAVAILGMVFNSVGDVHRSLTLWSVAIRQGQQLQLGIDSAHPQETYIEQQKRRRLWWTLVVCDWLPIPYRSPCINDIDFDCRLPDEIDDQELATTAAPSRLHRSKPRPIRYHIIMAKVAKIYYQLRYKLRLRKWRTTDIAEFVFSADEQLANLINELPAYLQFNVPPTTSQYQDSESEFIPWQRESLSLVFLYHRMAISRLLQEQWLDGSITGTRTRAICMSSARGLINCTLQMKDFSKLRPWYVFLLKLIRFLSCA